MTRMKWAAAGALLLGVSAYTLKDDFAIKVANKSFSEDTQLYLPDDLEATVWAESPQFYNPTNIDVDVKGRIWVTEAVNYRLYNNKGRAKLTHEAGDRVMILEDKDGDGKAETSKVFVQDKDLLAPLGIAVVGNKVIVSCAPSVIVYTDENGDDKPDKKEVFLTGFGGLDHDHSLHAFLAGPDGKWYFNAGNAGPHMVTDKAGWTLRSGSMYNGGSPYNKSNKAGHVSDDGKKWVGGLAMRINPDGKGLKVLGHNFRNSYELTVDSYGNMWQNDNDDDGNRGVRVSWLMEGGNMGYFSADGSRSWQADRRPGMETPSAHWHQEDPGVIPYGDNTGAGSPTGVAFNESDLLGEQYRGLLLACEAGRNVVLGYKPATQGAGFSLKRNNLVTSLPESEVENAKSFAAIGDKTKWFRPSDVAIGTDGAMYIADWHDPVVGGHRMNDSVGTGRIYRITPKGKKLTAPTYNLNKTKGQIAALLSPAVNVRHSGFVRLAAQGDKVLKHVKRLTSSQNPYHRARAVWLMSQLGPKGLAQTEAMLKDQDPNIRLTAFRALRQVKPDILPYARQLSKDASPAVRREVALALRDLPADQVQDIALDLASDFDPEDRYYVEALGLAFTDKEDKIYPVLASKMGAQPVAWSPQFERLAWRMHPAAAIDGLKIRAGAAMLSPEQRKRAMVALGFIKDRKAAEAMQSLLDSKLPDVKEQAAYWLRFRNSNEWSEFNLNLPDWVLAVPVSPEMQRRMLAQKERLLNPTTSQKDKLAAIATMAKDKTGGEMLIGLANEKKLSKELVDETSKYIFNNPDQSVRVLAGDYFKRPGATAPISISRISKLKGNAVKGHALFQAKCSTCHRVEKEGNDIGPELTLINKKFGKSGLLDAIVNPSAGMAFGYESWLITKKDGTTVSGFLQADGETLGIKTMGGQLFSVKAADVASRKQFNTSIMPEPGQLGLSEQDLANISEYLLTLKTDSK
ncbi:MAG: PVC-type heme-binding CxxCH protein [Adhaeribacter sp.]